MTTKRVVGGPIHLPDGSRVPVSQAVASGTHLFVSGQLAFGPGGSIVDGGIEAQTRQVLENLAAVLRKEGASLADVVKVTTFLVRREEFAAYNRVYALFFPEDPPARSTVVAQLLVEGALIEIEAVAAIPAPLPGTP